MSVCSANEKVTLLKKGTDFIANVSIGYHFETENRKKNKSKRKSFRSILFFFLPLKKFLASCFLFGWRVESNE